MRPKLERTFILGALLFLPVCLLAQEAVPLAAKQANAWGGVIKSVPDLFKALQTDEALPLLVVLCNMVVALLKTEWFQHKIMHFSKTSNELTDAGKTFLALGVGIGITWFFSPATTDVRTILKGLMLGFTAIGMYITWKHTLRDIFFKKTEDAQSDPLEGEQDPSDDEE